MGETDRGPDYFGSRVELYAYLDELGFTPRDSVTRKTDVLFVGPEWGGVKWEKALKLRIPIIPYPFPLAIGYFDRRQGSPFHTRELEVLALYVLTLADVLHAHYLDTRDQRIGDACRLVVGVLQRLLLLSRGPIGKRDPERDPDTSWADPESLAEIVREVETCWKLAEGYMKLVIESDE